MYFFIVLGGNFFFLGGGVKEIKNRKCDESVVYCNLNLVDPSCFFFFFKTILFRGEMWSQHSCWLFEILIWKHVVINWKRIGKLTEKRKRERIKKKVIICSVSRKKTTMFKNITIIITQILYIHKNSKTVHGNIFGCRLALKLKYFYDTALPYKVFAVLLLFIKSSDHDN